MVQALGARGGSASLAALLMRPGLPSAPSGAVEVDPRSQGPPDQITLSPEARQRAELAKQTVATLEAGGAWSSAAAFGWLLHQRLQAMLTAAARRTSGADPPPPARGSAVDLAA